MKHVNPLGAHTVVSEGAVPLKELESREEWLGDESRRGPRHLSHQKADRCSESGPGVTARSTALWTESAPGLQSWVSVMVSSHTAAWLLGGCLGDSFLKIPL